MTSGSDRLRVAVIGMGYGAAVARNARDSGELDCVLVCDSNEERARSAGELCKVRWTVSYEEVLASPEVEAVLIYTPPHIHGEQVIAAARAGKAIRVTKPFERSVTAAREAVRVVESTGAVAIADSPPGRLTGVYKLANEMIQAGELGDIISAAAYTGSFYDNVHPDGTWYDDPVRCPGGPIYRLGIYGINFFNIILGRPVQVSATQSWVRSTRPTPDTGSVTLLYENGALATITNSLSWGGMRYPDTTIIHGTKGSLLWNPSFAGIGEERGEVLFRSREGSRAIAPEQYRVEESENAYFTRLVRTRTAPDIPLARAIEGVIVLEGAYRSLAERRTVRLDEVG